MSTNESPSNPPRNPRNDPAATQSLHAVLAEYIRRRDGGESVSIEDFCRAYPELEDGLRSYAEGEGLLASLNQSASVESDDARSAETIRPGAAHRSDFAPQSEFGRYRLLRQLGNGAMGAVYLAEDTQLGRRVALKIPTRTGTEGPEFLKRFTREAQAAAQLEHINLCRIYDFGDVNGTPFISMEYIDGPPLSQCVGTAACRDQRRIAQIVSGIATGLHCAHQRGILHRDVKSSNVLMKQEETPCVTDFGLARVEGLKESKLTHEGSILGTPAYMAPEQIRSDQDRIGPHSDVYALGVVLYELLAGHTPFQGSTLLILNQALNERPRPLQKVRSDVDTALADFCLRMLEKAPEKRPQTMLDVVDFLQRWLKTTSPESQTQRARAEQERVKYEAMKASVLELVQRGQHAQAVDVLEKLKASTAATAKEYAEWARAKLPEVRKLPQQLRKAIPALLATAKQCIRAHDYAQAAQLLQDIPEDFRVAEVQQTLDKALSLQEESDLLLLALQECVRTRQFDGIDDNLKRFLKLKPGNKFARQLSESLETYSRYPHKDRRYRFDEKGRLQPHSSGGLWDNWVLMGTLCFAFVFGAAYWGITIYLKDGDRTLKVEINDDWLREQGGTLTLDVDGREHTIAAGDMDVKVKFGEQGFSVRNGDSIVHSPQTFTIQKGETQILHIDASGLRLDSIGALPVPGSGENAGYATRTLNPVTEFFHLKGPDERVRTMRSAGDRLFACTNKHAFVYSISLGNEIARIPLTGGTNGVACNASGTRMAVSCGNSVQVWDVTTQQKEFSVVLPDRDVIFLRLAADDEMNSVLGAVAETHLYKKASASLYLINCKERTATKVLELDGNGFNQVDVQYHPSRNLFYASRQTGTAERNLYEIDPKSAIATSNPFKGDGPGTLIPVAGTDLVAVATWSGETHLVNTRTWNEEASLRAVDQKYDHFVTASGDGSYLATSTHEVDGNNRILVTRVSDRRELFDIPANGIQEPSKMAFSGNSQYLAFAGEPSKNNADDDRFDIRVARLGMNETLKDSLSGMPNEVWPKLKPGTPLSGGSGLDGLSIGPGTKLTGTYIQQSPVATHDIVVTLKEHKGAVWHGEFESLQATPAGGGSPTRTGFKYACELTVASATTAQLKMTAITGNTSGNTIRDTTANWVEELAWDGKSLANGTMKLMATALTNVPADGWTDLFNGRDLNEWEILESFPDAQTPNLFTTHRASTGGWDIRDGNLLCNTDKPGLLRTRREYRDFRLLLEFKLPAKGNSGIYVRTPASGHLAHAGMEVQLVDEDRPDRKQPAVAEIGGIQKGPDATRKAARPVGNWNSMEVECAGDRVVVKVNGQLVNDANMESEATLRDKPRHGFVGISNWQGLAKGTEFRNIRIKELSSTSGTVQAAPVPNVPGADLPSLLQPNVDLLKHLSSPLQQNDWEKDSAGQLVFKGRGGKPLLLSQSLSSNYELEIEFRAEPELNQIAFTLPLHQDGFCAFVLRNHATIWGGLELIDGSAYFDGPATVTEKLLPRRDIRLKIRVQTSMQHTQIEVQDSGRPICQWAGATNRLSLTNHWNHGVQGRMAIGAGQDQRNVGKRSCIVTSLRYRDIVERVN